MALTRANAEFLLVAQTGPLLTAAGMATTVAGSNASLNDPIGRAVRNLGYTVGSAVLIGDTDVAQITDAQLDEFLDVATLHVLNAILTNLDDVDITAGPRTEKLSQLAVQVERRAIRLQTTIAQAYGYGLAVPEARYITVNIAEHD